MVNNNGNMCALWNNYADGKYTLFENNCILLDTKDINNKNSCNHC